MYYNSTYKTCIAVIFTVATTLSLNVSLDYLAYKFDHNVNDILIKERMRRLYYSVFKISTPNFNLLREIQSYIHRWRLPWRSGGALWRGSSWRRWEAKVGGEPKSIDAGEEEMRCKRRGKNRLRITRRVASYTNRLRATSMRHGCQLADWHRPDWPPCTVDQSFLRFLLRGFAFYHHHTIIITIFSFFFSFFSSFFYSNRQAQHTFLLFFSCPFQFFCVYALVTALTDM